MACGCNKGNAQLNSPKNVQGTESVVNHHKLMLQKRQEERQRQQDERQRQQDERQKRKKQKEEEKKQKDERNPIISRRNTRTVRNL